jgi:hypothetical protein
VDVIDSSTVSVSGEGLYSAKVYRQTWFNLDLHGMDPADLEVSVIGMKFVVGMKLTNHSIQRSWLPYQEEEEKMCVSDEVYMCVCVCLCACVCVCTHE